MQKTLNQSDENDVGARLRFQRTASDSDEQRRKINETGMIGMKKEKKKVLNTQDREVGNVDASGRQQR